LRFLRIEPTGPDLIGLGIDGLGLLESASATDGRHEGERIGGAR